MEKITSHGPFLLYLYGSVNIDNQASCSQRRQESRLILFYKIINGLAQVPYEGNPCWGV